MKYEMHYLEKILKNSPISLIWYSDILKSHVCNVDNKLNILYYYEIYVVLWNICCIK